MQERGYIIIIVMIILLSLSLLNLSTLTALKSTIHLQSLLTQTTAAHDAALHTLHVLASQTPSCEIPPIPSKTLIHSWQFHLCSHSPYFYAYESLPTDPCMRVQELPAQIYRLTLVLPAKHVHDMNVFMQAIIIKPKNTKQKCLGQFNNVSPGIQVIREL